MIDDHTVSALSALPWRLAGILAFLVDTSLFAGAAEIVSTARLAYAILTDLSLCTSAVRVANCAAGATHATFIGKAILIIAALSLTASSVAQLIRPTVLVASTGDTWLLASHIGISGQSFGTAALLAMIDGLADGIGAT